MLDLLNDPEIDKLIIYGLAGVCAVLLIAVIFLAVKRNVYYIDEDGDEVVEEKPRRSRKKEKPVQEEVKPEPVPAPAPVPVETAMPAAEEEVQGQTAVVDLRQLAETSQPQELEATRISLPAIQADDSDDDDEEDVRPETLEVPLAVKQPAPKSAVVAVTISGETTHREIEYFPCLMGRDASSCNLVISEPAVSRRHARIFVQDDQLYVEDVSEHNGTYINGTKLASLGRAPLHEGDRISLGRAEIAVTKLLY